MLKKLNQLFRRKPAADITCSSESPVSGLMMLNCQQADRTCSREGKNDQVLNTEGLSAGDEKLAC